MPGFDQQKKKQICELLRCTREWSKPLLCTREREGEIGQGVQLSVKARKFQYNILLFNNLIFIDQPILSHLGIPLLFCLSYLFHLLVSYKIYFYACFNLQMLIPNFYPVESPNV